MVQSILRSLGHGLSGMSRWLCFLLALVVERRYWIDWRILGSLCHSLHGLSRWV